MMNKGKEKKPQKIRIKMKLTMVKRTYVQKKNVY